MESAQVLDRLQLDLDDQGPALEPTFLQTGLSAPVLAFGTAYGDIVGWDFRVPTSRQSSGGGAKGSFRFRNGPRNGIQTALAVSDDQVWFASGTDTGHLVCWDFRFQLPTSRCDHPSGTRVRQMLIPPGSGSPAVLVAVKGHNEVAWWNMETQSRSVMLWASVHSPMSKQRSEQSVTCMQTVNTAQQNLVLTAGVDGRIRFWDVKKESESFVVAGSGGERIGPANVKYTRKIVDGVDVIQEVSASPKQDSSSSSPGPSSPKAKGGGLLPSLHSPPQLQQQQKQQQQSPQPSLPSYMGMDQLVNKPGLEPPALGHHDWISSLSLCQGTNPSDWYIVSGSRDGVIKVWT